MESSSPPSKTLTLMASRSAELEQQQENLRRAIDQWSSRALDLISNLNASDPFSFRSPQSPGPIHVHVAPMEHADLSSLIDSDDVAISKLVAVLSYDCIEIARLQKLASRNLYRQLLLFGHRSSPLEVLLEGVPQKAFAESLPLFMELYETVRRLGEILGNLLQQLNAVYSINDKNMRPLNLVKKFMLKSVFESLGEGFTVLLVLDEILKQNGLIRSYLSLFARVLNNAKLELDTFGISVDDEEFLDQVVSHLEKLLSFGVFQHLLQGEASWNSMLQQVRSNKKFSDACTSCICDGLPEILTRLDSWKEYPFDRRKTLQYLGLFLFSTYVNVETTPERKTWKLILEILQILPVIYVEGGKRILIVDVLKSQCHQSLSSWSPMREACKDCDVMLSKYLTRLSEMQLRDWRVIKDSLSCWVASFQSTIHPLSETSSEACIKLHVKQIIQGILLANRMHILVLSILDLHALLEIPIKKEKLRCLCHMVISVKVLGNTFQLKGPEMVLSLPHIINIIQTDIEQLILPLKEKLHVEVVKGSQARRLGVLSSLKRGGRDTDSRLTDSLSLALMSLQMIQGGGSFKRQHILLITLDILQSIGNLDVDFLRVRKRVLKLAIVADYQNIVEEVTNCSFLYWRKEMIESWFSLVYMDVTRFSLLQYLLDAVSDGLWLLKLGHVGKLTLQSYEKEIENALENEIIGPLCRDVETDLRLHVHSTHLKGSVYVNPTMTGVRNLSWYLQMTPLSLPFKFIDLRLLVESYLNSVFYNHTAMSPKDWKMYSDMRQLAEMKYGLALDDTHLSEHSHDLDIMQVVQNLHTFSEKYSYNMVKQIFIQKVPNTQGSKNVKLIDTDCVASSISRHGLRIISTASSYIFKYLSQMFASLSECFKDNYVRSNLAQESNFWKNNKEKPITTDLFSQGEIVSLIGKSLRGDHGLNFLEELRSIFTKMGSALGLMRIILAGCSHYRFDLSRFISGSNGDTSFMENAQKLDFPKEVIMAGKVMDETIGNTFDDHIETFSSIVNTFSKKLLTNQYHEMGDIFLIIPSLVLHMVDSKVHYKDKTLRKDDSMGNIINAYDGFIMGVSFALKVTVQEEPFDDLDWFALMKRTLNEAVVSLQQSCRSPEQKGGFRLWSQPPSISSEAQKGIDKYMSHLKETELVEYGFNIARTIMSLNCQ